MLNYQRVLGGRVNQSVGISNLFSARKENEIRKHHQAPDWEMVQLVHAGAPAGGIANQTRGSFFSCYQYCNQIQ